MVNKVYKVVLAQNAISSLRKIYDFYTENISSDLGIKIKTELLKSSRQLSKFPNSNTILPTEKQVVPPIRYSKKWSFKIIYQVFE